MLRNETLMNTRLTLSASLLVVLAGAAVFAAEAAADDRPNLILVMADDCSAREFSAYGNRTIHTPHLDALGASGVMFNTCWAAPICSPSRAMIMTGRYAYRTRWYHNDMKPAADQPGGNLADDNLIFAQILKRAGYATAICGKWQLRGTQQAYGFEETCMHAVLQGQFDGPIEPPEGNLPGRPARYWHPAVVLNGEQLDTDADDYGPDIYVDFLIDFARRHKDRPFVVYYPMSLTHITWDFDREVMGYVAPPEVDAAGRKTGRKGEPSLKANVEYTDHLMGRIAAALDEIGIRRKTVLLFTCDNGTAGYGKSNLVEERGPRVPLVVNGPGLVEPIGPSDALVDFSDVLPTLVDLAGAELPPGYEVDGTSFAPVLRGEKAQTREWIFTNFADRRMIRDARWLLDGRGRLFDCGPRRDEQDYRDVTKSSDPTAQAARARLEAILERFPIPAPDDPLMEQYAKKQQAQKARRQKSKAAWEKKQAEKAAKQK